MPHPARWLLGLVLATATGMHLAARRRRRHTVRSFLQAMKDGQVRVYSTRFSSPDPGVHELAYHGEAQGTRFHFAARVNWRGRRVWVLTWTGMVKERWADDERPTPLVSLAAISAALRRLPVRPHGSGR